MMASHAGAWRVCLVTTASQGCTFVRRASTVTFRPCVSSRGSVAGSLGPELTSVPDGGSIALQVRGGGQPAQGRSVAFP
jgi:hypothetical protein